ncbi:MAG: alanine racemase [Bacteroidetes bacterium]|nr:alanine racemase [Bacteroidota bacterium]
MKLNLTLSEFFSRVKGLKVIGSSSSFVDEVVYDSRKIISSKSQVFFALKGDFRDGHAFVENAYEKGVRLFVVQQMLELKSDACYVLVDDCLKSLQHLAKTHRAAFNIPVVAITGSSGKTTVKEWIYHLVKGQVHVTRSPKSYNSQLGVALSLLTINEETELALIEAGISEPGEMAVLADMIQPTIGILTNIGSAHSENFENRTQHLREKLDLFSRVLTIYSLEDYNDLALLNKNLEVITEKSMEKSIELLPFKDKASKNSAMLAIGFVERYFRLDVEKIKSLPRLALRLETFEGIDNSLIINDSYNLDLDSLKIALEYQLSISQGRERVALIGLNEDDQAVMKRVYEIINQFQPIDAHVYSGEIKLSTIQLKDSVILLKGQRAKQMEKLAQKLKLKHHKTQLAFNMTAIRHNLSIFKSKLASSTKILCMVKAQSYGVGLEKMGSFLEKCGADYLGVAYSDEGVELRKAGIKLPILVMNPEEDGYENCMAYNLEPAVYSQEQLEELISELIYLGAERMPIHLKIDTGMHRLGIKPEELSEVLEVIQAQPEVQLKGVYSHLAAADYPSNHLFTAQQIELFKSCVEQIQSYNSDVIFHLCNSEGALHFPSAQFDMIRVGIGLYGISKDPVISEQLKPVLEWKSVVSQVKEIPAGESVGYGRSYLVEKNTVIAIVPVGYADGFRRNLSNGKGAVYLKGQRCETVGRVCMDMIMVNTTGLDVKEGDEVEIIGEHQKIEQLAQAMETIPYEVLTSLSKRVYRTYFEE